MLVFGDEPLSTSYLPEHRVLALHRKFDHRGQLLRSATS
jgi:hypothetical protein